MHGIVNLTAIGATSVQEAESGIRGELRKESRDGGLVPEVKRLLEQPPMAGCGEEMAAQAKDSVDRLEHTEKTLSVLWRVKALLLRGCNLGDHSQRWRWGRRWRMLSLLSEGHGSSHEQETEERQRSAER